MKLIVLGAGSRGDAYARYATESGVEIAGVAEPNEERRQVFCEKYNVPQEKQFASWQEALAGEKYADAVVNSTLDRVHYESTMAALEKGYHVLLEKPMSPVESECRAMVEKAEEKGLVLMVCHVLRYAPFFEKLKELLDEKRIGESSISSYRKRSLLAFCPFLCQGQFPQRSSIQPWILAKSCHDPDACLSHRQRVQKGYLHWQSDALQT